MNTIEQIHDALDKAHDVAGRNCDRWATIDKMTDIISTLNAAEKEIARLEDTVILINRDYGELTTRFNITSAELADVDGVLARRSALDDFPTRGDKIRHLVSENAWFAAELDKWERISSLEEYAEMAAQSDGSDSLASKQAYINALKHHVAHLTTALEAARGK